MGICVLGWGGCVYGGVGGGEQVLDKWYSLS